MSYRRKHLPLNYWRTQHGHEVDFILGDQVAIEVKATSRVTEKHLHGLRLLTEEKICRRYILVSLDPIMRRYEECEVMSWQEFLQQLWGDQII